MSDSSLSDGAPSAAVLEQALRNAVREVYRSGDLDNLTVKRIRKAVEADLDLPDDFFKNDPAWKEESKIIIQSEVDSQADVNGNGSVNSVQPSADISPRPPPKSKKAQPNLPKPQKPNRDFRGTKRLSGDKIGSNKRRRKETPDTEGSVCEEKDVSRRKPIPKPKKRASSEEIENDEETGQISEDISGSPGVNRRKSEASESELSEVLDEAPETKGRKLQSDSANPSAKANRKEADASDDEMSEVLDEAPKAKGRKRRSDSGKPRAKKTETTNRKKSSEQSTDPDADEIKRLQGWLIKCGIRKMWHRELAPYDDSKAKIGHLKKLLADAGMTGRYSIEKANQIKEERELRADLEAVQEGAKAWGKAESEGEDEASSRPKRRLARGLQELGFLNDEDGEETD